MITTPYYQRIVLILALCHISIITASNYLVQIPLTVAGFHTTWGALSFPFIFLATDLTVRLLGAPLARQVIGWVMFPALAISYVISALFLDGAFQGWASLATLNIMVARIALASFLAYCVGQLLDIVVFTRLRQLPRWWVAPCASTLLGNSLDTLVFFSVAFYRSTDAFLAEHWIEIALLDYGCKLLISTLLFLPLYGILLNKLSAVLQRHAITGLQLSPAEVVLGTTRG